MPDLWETFGRMWTYEFMVRGIVVTAIAGAVCAIISCWIVLVGWSLMGDALSHAVLPGVVVAHMLGIPYSVGALAAALLVVGLIFAVRQTSHLKSDASMGIVFTTLFAIGLVLVSKNPSNINLSHVLFGDLLGITQADMWQVLILGPLAGAVLLLKGRWREPSCFSNARTSPPTPSTQCTCRPSASRRGAWERCCSYAWR